MQTQRADTVTITWVGHATVVLEVDGFRVITDPLLTNRVVHLRRRVAVPTIDPVDAVLISHLHMDHLHLRSLRTVTDGARVIAPAGSAKLFRSLGVRQLDEVVAGDVVTLRAATGDAPAIEAHVVPADHSNARGPHSRIVAEPVLGRHRAEVCDAVQTEQHHRPPLLDGDPAIGVDLVQLHHDKGARPRRAHRGDL